MTLLPASHASILNCAEAVFARQGLANTSVADLLSAAGVSRRTFYKSFDNKEAVLAALYTERTEILMLALEQARRSGDPTTVLMSGLDVYLDYHAAAGPLLRILIEEAGRSGSLLAERRTQFRTALLAFINDAARVEVDPWLFHAMLAAMEGISLQLLASDMTKAELRRAKKVARLIVQRAFLPELGLAKSI